MSTARHILLLILFSSIVTGKRSKNVVNLDDYLKGLEQIEQESGAEVKSESDWRTGLSVVQKNEYLLSNDLLTDCTVLVGPEREPIKAHSLFLSRASPILAAYLRNNTNTIYLDDISADYFRSILRYLYGNSFCASDAEEACVLLKHAKRYQMTVLEEKIKAYLWVNMYPDKVWHTFRCATDNGDQFLTDSALQVISWRTEELITDASFLALPHSALTQMLQLKTLNLTTEYTAPVSSSGPLPPVAISAELKLFDGLLRWAVAECERKGLEPSNPESIRGVLGPVFKNLHAIMLEFDDFTRDSIPRVSDPSYNEALDVLYNTNSVYQPSVLHSPSLRSKKADILEIQGTGLDFLSCNRSSRRNIFDILTTSPVPKGYGGRTLLGVQIPAKQVNRGDLCVAAEDFTVEVINGNGELLREQRVTLAQVNVCANTASKQVDVLFDSGVILPSGGARVRVIFHSSPGKYPSTCSGFYLNNPPSIDGSTQEVVKQSDSFICSYVFEKK